MYRLRQVTSGVVTRKIPSTLTIQTVFGEELLKIPCPSCIQLKYRFEFYLKANATDSVRYQCVECWDIYNGRNPNKKEKKQYVCTTIESFFDEATVNA
jgi:hypothetical protein